MKEYYRKSVGDYSWLLGLGTISCDFRFELKIQIICLSNLLLYLHHGKKSKTNIIKIMAENERQKNFVQNA